MKVPYLLRMPEDLKTKLDEITRKKGFSLNTIIIIALNEFVLKEKE